VVQVLCITLYVTFYFCPSCIHSYIWNF